MQVKQADAIELVGARPGSAAIARTASPSLPLRDAALPHQLGDFAALTKPRITSLVVATTFTGFYLASPGPLAFAPLVHTLLGTWLVASAAAAINQVYERDTDRLMRRTRERPLPAGRLEADGAASFAILLAVVGVLELGIEVNVLAAAVAVLSLVVYAAVYTPLQMRTPFALTIGAIPGALPPVVGCAGASGRLGLGAALLFLVMFLWQVPHFLAIAWMCREDYARAGFKVLSVVDEDGSRTARQTLVYSVLLVLSTLLPVAAGVAAPWFAAAALVLGAALLYLAVVFIRAPGAAASRRLFLASLLYLPLVFGALIVAWR